MKKKLSAAFSFLTAAVIASLAAAVLLLTSPEITNEHMQKYMEAKNAYITGDLQKAISLTGDLSKKSPRLYQARLLLGKSYYLTDQYSEADDILGKLVKKHPAYLEAGLWKAKTEIQLDRLDDAADRIEFLLSYNSDDPRLLGLMANIEEMRGDFGRAIDFYIRSSLYEEELAKNRLSLGKLYSRLGVYDKSYSELIEAREMLEPDSPLYKPLNAIINEVRKRMED